MNEQKTFLPSPRYKPLRNAVYSFIVGILAFGLIILGTHREGAFTVLTIIGVFIFVIAFISAVYYWFKYFWVMFLKGGWKDEHNEHIESLKPKQPWER
jgi:phosphoglycerol transferase MdoB-like AlkP superfamily enzyme